MGVTGSTGSERVQESLEGALRLKVFDFGSVFLEEKFVVFVSLGITADVNFGRLTGAEGVLDTLNDDRIHNERAGRSRGGSDVTGKSIELQAGVAVDSAIIDGEFGDFGEVFSTG